MKTLHCSQCRLEHPAGTLGRCTKCDGILSPEYSDETVQSLAMIPPGEGVDRYRSVLPTQAAIPYLGEGNTPLISSRRIGHGLGLKSLFFKHEGCNPSGAFKDRAGALAAALAQEAGAKGVITASSGNAAAALAAYAAAAGLRCLILLEPEAPPAKLRQIVLTGAKVIPVDGLFSREIGRAHV